MIPKTLEIISGWTKEVTSGIAEHERELFYKILHKITQQAVVICKNNKCKKAVFVNKEILTK